MTFQPTGVEAERIETWRTTHEARCVRHRAAIGGKLTFEFTPTSLGTVIKVRCACGESTDATEYEAW